MIVSETAVYFKILLNATKRTNVSRIIYSRHDALFWLHRKNLTDYIQFLFENRFQVNKKIIFSSEKVKISVIISMITLTRSSGRIYNSMRYAGM